MIYFFANNDETWVKIGYSENPEARKVAFETIEHLHTIGIMNGSQDIETAIKRRWASLRLDAEEKFDLTPELRAFISANDIRSMQEIARRHESYFAIVTPMEAAQWLEWYAYDKQRKLRPSHVKALRFAMEKGEFKPTAQVAFVTFRNKKSCVNGNHTLAAIAAYNKPVVLNIVCHRAELQEEVGLIYAAYDIQLRRQFGELAEGMDAPSLSGLGRNFSKAGNAVGLIYNNFMRGKRANFSVVDHVMATMHYAEATKVYLDAIRGSGLRDKMLNKGIMAVALVTLHDSSEKLETAIEFWRQVALGDGLGKDDPRKELHIFVRTAKVAGGGAKGESYRPEAMSRYAAHCWNGWIKGKRYRSPDWEAVGNGKEPIRIETTPFQGQSGDVLPWPPDPQQEI